MPWSEEEIINTMELVFEGVHELHSKGIVHADLKAKNIVFCEDKNVKLADQFVHLSLFRRDLKEMILHGNCFLAPEVILGYYHAFFLMQQ